MNDDFNFWISQVNACPEETAGYTIKEGDTLYNIARIYETTVTAILGANPGINLNRLEIGGRICIPTPSSNPCPNGFNYTIQPGDTLYQLAIRFKVTVTIIISANPGVNPYRLAVGQIIRIPGTHPVSFSQLKLPSCIIMEPTASLNPLPDLPALPQGSVLLREADQPANVFALLYAANGLPTPNTLGNYDAYLGSIRTQTGLRSTFLEPSASFGQPLTWAGTLLMPLTPQVGDILEVRPVNISNRARGEALLRGILD